jgi:hypothetical protein
LKEKKEFCLFAPLLGCWRISQEWIREEIEERESLARSASYENRLGTKQMIKKRETREDRRGAKENGRE